MNIVAALLLSAASFLVGNFLPARNLAESLLAAVEEIPLAVHKVRDFY